jgi:hypothetical protein
VWPETAAAPLRAQLQNHIRPLTDEIYFSLHPTLRRRTLATLLVSHLFLTRVTFFLTLVILSPVTFSLTHAYHSQGVLTYNPRIGCEEGSPLSPSGLYRVPPDGLSKGAVMDHIR